jgi:transposase
VINTLNFKVLNVTVHKTDKYDAATIAEFLEADMLPEAHLCGRTSEQLRRLLKARTTLVQAQVVMKNQIHALLTAEGMEDVKGSLQSKRGRKRTLDTLIQCENGLSAQPLIETIERLEENVKGIEERLRALTAGDRVVELLQTIPGCGEIGAWTIRAYTDDTKRFASAKKYTAYAGLVPWVQSSNETTRYGKITKRGPKELRTAFVQVVMGMRRMKAKTCEWRLMQRYEAMKKTKSHPGIAVIAAARKVASIIWHMLSDDTEFDIGRMVDRKPAKKSGPAELAKEALTRGREKPVSTRVGRKSEKKTGVAGEKRKKAG